MLSFLPSLSILGCANVLVEIRKVLTEVEGINPRYVVDNTSTVLQSQTSFFGQLP